MFFNLSDGGSDALELYSTPDGTTKEKAISVEDCYYYKNKKPRSQGCDCRGAKSVVIDLTGDDEFHVFKGRSKASSRLKTECSGSKPIYIEIDNDDDDDGGGMETGPPPFMCQICYEVKQANENFRIMGCDHSHCFDCISKFVASKIRDNIARINCPNPGCAGVLEPHHCASILPKNVFDRWGDVLCEALLLASEKFYCPFKDCSALLLDEKMDVVQSECPECRRLFCAKCKVPWHPDMACSEFQKLHKDERESGDLQLMHLAKDKQWKRCPKCGVFVERTEGCAYMTCRCKCSFCYKCGARTKKDHYCRKCGT